MSLDELHDRGRGELLGERADLERRCGRDGDLVFKVRKAVALHEERVASAHHGDGDARDGTALHGRRSEGIDVRDERRARHRGRSWLRVRGTGAGEQQRGNVSHAYPRQREAMVGVM